MTVSTWSTVLSESFRDVWLGVINFVPNLVVALVIIMLGWAIGALLGRVVSQIIKSLRVDNALQKAGIESMLTRGGLNLNSGRFIGGLVEWFVIIVFLIGAFEVLGLSQVNMFLRDILVYLPQVIVAVLVLLVGGVVGDVMKKVVIASAKTAAIGSANFLGSITKWVIWVFAILVALSQLGIASAFIQTVFTGLVVALSLALGLAFGLGGQDAAGRLVDRLGKEISDRS